MWQNLPSIIVVVLPCCASALQSFSVQSYGAVGNGQVATDCSMLAGSANLTCGSAHFTSSDAGSVIGVYGAGPTTNGYVQPLSTTIVRVIGSNSATLSAIAGNSVSPSPRTVWGTDDTANLQRAVDATASTAGSGGELYFPAGTYLTHGLKLPCSTVGTFAAGVCTKSYNNIWLHGAGQDVTVLENWDISTSYAAYAGLVWLGGESETPFVEPTNSRLSNITISDMTLHQVTNSTQSLKIVTSKATDTVEIRSVHITGGSYEGIVMGGAGRSQRWWVHDNVADNVGLSGPAYTSYLSAWNIAGENWIVENNTASNIGQCAEIGTDAGVVRNNMCKSSPPNGVAINVGSDGAGAYDLVISGNQITNFGNCIIAANGNGPLDRLYVYKNTCVDAGAIVLLSGQETVNYNDGQALDTTIHGWSLFDENIQIFNAPLVSEAIGVGGHGLPQTGLESVSITNHQVFFTHSFCLGGSQAGNICNLAADCDSHLCQLTSHVVVVSGFEGGGNRWRPSTPYNQGDVTVPDISNGFYYRCTTAGTSGAVEPIWAAQINSSVTDGGVVWVNKGTSPVVTISNLKIMGPTGAIGSGREFTIDQARRENIVVNSAVANFPWTVTPNNDNQAETFEDMVPPNQVYGDTNRFSNSIPTLGRYDLGTQINNTSPISSPPGWTVTRAGHAAPVWMNGTAYGFGMLVVPIADNGHFYMQIADAGCTSSGIEPIWPTTSGGIINDGACTWIEGGQAVQFTPLR
jgi:pectate lyase-like protein